MRTFNLDQAAEFLNMSPDSVRDLAASGVLPAAKIGKCWLLTDEDMEAFIRDEVKRQTADRRKLSGFLVADQIMARPMVQTAFSRSVRRRPMEPPKLTVPLDVLTAPQDVEPAKAGRRARPVPPLPK